MINLKKDDNPFSEPKKKKWELFLMIFAIVIVLILILLLFIIPGYGNGVTTFPTCGDGTFYNSCSIQKPYYCNSGILVDNSSVCGCPDLFSKSNNSCISNYESSPETINFNYVLNGNNKSINFTLYKGVVTYLLTLPDSIIYTDGQQPLRSDFTLLRINEQNQEVLLSPLVKEIQNLAPNSTVDQARIAISLVQNIPWGTSDEILNFGGGQVDYSRYPYQVLYDNQGSCSEKSELLAFILRDLGYGSALFYYSSENHEALGIKCPVKDSLNGTGYCFVETSGPAIISDNSLEYSGGITLSSSPQVILISNGISLPDNMAEYTDAKTMTSLSKMSSVDPISAVKLNELEQKYGLSKVYNIS